MARSIETAEASRPSAIFRYWYLIGWENVYNVRHISNGCGSASFLLPRGRLAWCCSLTRDPLQVHNSPSTSPLVGLSLSFRLIYLPLLTCPPRLRTISRRLQPFYHQKINTRIVGIRETLTVIMVPPTAFFNAPPSGCTVRHTDP